MPNRGRLRDIAALGLIGLAFVLAVGWLLAGKYERDRAYDAAHQEYENAKRLSPPGAMFPGERAVTNPRGYREEWRGEHDLEAQREMSDWTFAMVLASCITIVVTGIGVYYVAQTLKETRSGAQTADRAVAVTREIGMAETRAYVHLSHESPGLEVDAAGTVYGNANHSVGVTLAVINTGQTPARITQVCINLRELPEAIRKIGGPDYANMDMLHDGEVILPHGEKLVLAGIVYNFNRPFNTDFVLYGYVDYTDVFGVRHRGGYARRYGRPIHDDNNLVYVTELGWNYDRPRLSGEGSET